MQFIVQIDDKIGRAAMRYAEERDLPVDRAIEDLLRRSLESDIPIQVVNGYAQLLLPPDAPPLTTEHLLRLEDQI